MSDSQAYDRAQVSSDGVTVTKRFEADEFPVPAIAFEFESERDESVLVKLIDAVPDSIEVEDLGFHPEYGSEFWTIEDDSITFERDLEAGASYTTVYGIRATDTDNIEQFLTEPTLERVDPPLSDDEEIIPETGDDVIKDAIAGDGEIPGLDDEDDGDDTTEEDVGTLDLKDPNTDGETGPRASTGKPDTSGGDSADGSTTDSADDSTTDSADDSTTDSADEQSGSVSVDDSVVSALAEEIRQGDVSAEDVKLLRRAFEVAGEEGGTINAQIRQIQTDIADLRAYTGSLEEFLDENGTGEQLIEEFDGQLDSFREQLDSFEGQLDELETEMSGVSEDVESVQTEMSGVSEEVDELGEDVDRLSETVDTVSEDVDEFGEEMETVTADMDSLEATIDDIEGEIQEIREEMTDGDVDERVDSMAEDIEDLKTWQEQIKQTFGGG